MQQMNEPLFDKLNTPSKILFLIGLVALTPLLAIFHWCSEVVKAITEQHEVPNSQELNQEDQQC